MFLAALNKLKGVSKDGTKDIILTETKSHSQREPTARTDNLNAPGRQKKPNQVFQISKKATAIPERINWFVFENRQCEILFPSLDWAQGLIYFQKLLRILSGFI